MSYQVLARKWRPRNFSSLVGQEHVVRALTHALSEKRLHHAYLFTGTRGVGKTTIARILAKSLNCESGVTATPCGLCSACQEIDAGRFVDLLEVDAATNTRVDEMRQLLENAVYAPTRGRYKVYVIDEVHMLSNSAFNAMLKTLEEPPEHVKFILATTDPQKIPVTVLSRCLQFNLKQMAVVGIIGHLKHILDLEGITYDQPSIALLARSANGSMRDALSLLDQAIAHGAGVLDESMVREMLGTVDAGYLFEILEALSEENAAALVGRAASMAVRSISFASALQELGVLLTRVQVEQFAPVAGDDAGDPDAERLKSIARLLSPEYVQLAYQIVSVGRQELVYAPDEYSGFLMTLLRLHAFKPIGAKEIAKRPVGLAPAKSQEPPAGRVRNEALRTPDDGPKAPTSQPTPPSATVSRQDLLSSNWFDIVPKLNLAGLARELAQNCELRSLDKSLCILRLPSGLGHLQMKPSPDRLQAALSDYLGYPVLVRIELGAVEGETPALANGRQRQELAEKAAGAIQQDAFVQDAISILDASVIQTSIKPL